MSTRPGSARSRTSSKGSYSRPVKQDNDLLYGCKAAYHVVFEDLSDRITSRNQLAEVLQQSGRNPTQKVLNRYWQGNDLTFDDFCRICADIPKTSADDLLKAFRKVDINGDGFVTNSELRRFLTAKGERMTEQEVDAIIAEVDADGNGKLDYGEFCKMLLSTQEEVYKLGVAKMERHDRRKAAHQRKQEKQALESQASRGSQKTEKESESEGSDSEENGKSASPKGSRASIDKSAIGSHVSLRSSKAEVQSEEAIRSSRTSLRSTKSARKNSVKDTDETEDIVPSNSRSPTGSLRSVRSNRSTRRSDASITDKESEDTKTTSPTGSVVSVRSSKQESKGDAEKDENASVKDAMGSKVSLRSNRSRRETVDANEPEEKAASKAPTPMGSLTSLRSKKSRRDSEKDTEKVEEKAASPTGSVVSVHSNRSKIHQEKEEEEKEEKLPSKAPTPMGSQVSLRSSKSKAGKDANESEEAAANKTMGSQVSLRSNKSKRETAETKEEGEKGASKAPTPMGSQVSLRSSKSKRESDNNENAPSPTGSQVSLRSNKSRRTLREESIKDEATSAEPSKEESASIRGSRASWREGSVKDARIAVETAKEERASIHGSRTSLKSGSSTDTLKAGAEGDVITAEEQVALESKPTDAQGEATGEPEVQGSRASLRRHMSRTRQSIEEKPKESPKPAPRASLTPSSKPEASEDDSESDSDSDVIVTPTTKPKSGKAESHVYGKPPKPQQRKSRTLSSKDDSPRSMRKATSSGSKRKQAVSETRLKLSKPSGLQSWSNAKAKGCFLFDEENRIASYQYDLKLTRKSSVWITIKPDKAGEGAPVDTTLYIVDDSNVLMAFTDQRNHHGAYGTCCELSAGNYRVLPFTSGCRFKPRRKEPEGEEKLTSKTKDGDITLTRPFREALTHIFSLADVDGDGLLSREEFSFYNLWVSGEQVSDDEWQVVEENVELRGGNLTLEGFLKLNQMEAEDTEDPDDLWETLDSWGYNRSLVQDEACPYTVEAWAENGDVTLRPCDLASGGRALETAVIEAVRSKGEMRSIRGMKDLFLHVYETDYRASYVIENKSHSGVKIRFDYGDCENCVSNRRGKEYSIDVPNKSVLAALHFMPQHENKDWVLDVQESVTS